MNDDVINYLTRQILSQNTTKYWTGEGFGSYESNAKDMAKILSSIGITDIKQFGEVKKYEEVEQIGFTYNGMRAQNPSQGVYYVEEPVTDSEGGISYVRRDLSAEEAKQVKPVYGVASGYDEATGMPSYTPVDVSSVITKDGKTMGVTGTTYGNKVTGQAVSNTYGERQTGNAWGGTYAGDGNTGYRVQFAENGMPVFYTTHASSSDFDDIAPLVGFALMAIPGLNVTVGTTLLGAGANTVAAGMVGSAVIGGTMAELSGGDFVKGAVTGAITSGVSSQFSTDVGKMLGLEGDMASKVGSAIISGAKAELTGGDFLSAAAIDGMISGVSSATGYSTKDIKSTISFVTALDSGDPARIAAAAANMTKLDYFNDKKASEILGKLKNAGYEDLPEITDEELQEWSKTKDYTFLGDDYTGTEDTKVADEEAFDATEISHGGKAGDTSYTGTINGLDLDKSKSTSIGLGDIAKGAIGAATINAALNTTNAPTSLPEEAMTGKGYRVGKYSADIYKDAPIQGFAMRRYEDSAGNTRYVPFIGDQAQLDVPAGYTFKGYEKGGFVKRRS